MKHMRTLIVLCTLFVALGVACGQAFAAPSVHASIDESREVVCWGDSLTKGVGAGPAHVNGPELAYDASYKGYPEILQDFCGYRTFNFGVNGATSRDLVALQSGSAAEVSPDLFETSEELRAFMQQCSSHPGNILVLEIGSNGGWDNDYDTLVAQYRQMIRYVGCEQYLVIGDTDDPGTSIGDRDQDPFERRKPEPVDETAWEAALKEAFGDHFINMRRYLIENGLDVCGITKNTQDVACAERGIVSHRLRSDWTHLNSYGYFAQAWAIHERGVALGYWK